MNKLDSKTDLTYKGNVTLKLKIKDKIVEISNHNSGTQALFKCFAKILCGYDLTANEKPSVIDVQYYNNNTQQYESCLNNPLTFSKMFYNTDKGWGAIFSTTLIASNISVDVATMQLTPFRLCLKSRKEILATIEMEQEDLQRIVLGSQGLIEWTLRVSDGTV